jgi:hypothetical protein
MIADHRTDGDVPKAFAGHYVVDYSEDDHPLRGAYPHSVIASLWGSKLLVDQIASGFQESHHMQERRLLRPCGARNDAKGQDHTFSY